MYQMLVTDVDGTLLDSRDRIPQETKEKLSKLKEKGFIITIATGRMLKRAEPIAREIMVNAPIICYNGALVVDIYTGRKIFEKAIPHDKLSFLLPLLKSRGYEPVLFPNETLLIEKLNEKTHWYIKLCQGVEYNIVSNMEDFVLTQKVSTLKVIALADIQHPSPKDERLLEILEKEYDTSYSDQGHLEITMKSVNKGSALKILSDELRIDRKNIIAIGDGENDISMLKYAGLGSAMGNADENIKNYADYVTVSESKNAFLDIIKKFC